MSHQPIPSVGYEAFTDHFTLRALHRWLQHCTVSRGFHTIQSSEISEQALAHERLTERQFQSIRGEKTYHPDLVFL
nr:hypothetical protein CFP56_01428 [Quercus suber]